MWYSRFTTHQAPACVLLVGGVSGFLAKVSRVSLFYFLIFAYTSLIPCRITSAFVIPVSLQQNSRIRTSSSDILILVSFRFGSWVGLPVLGDIYSPLFCVTINILRYGDTKVKDFLTFLISVANVGQLLRNLCHILAGAPEFTVYIDNETAVILLNCNARHLHPPFKKNLHLLSGRGIMISPAHVGGYRLLYRALVGV